ncbi:MAG: hypothetical protein II781_05015 [Clostridia bacterium]|nr:hypothetical protein [Clostridia bacterium]
MYVLALEASTSSAKAMVFSPDEGQLALSAVPYSKDIGDIVTLDADGVFECMLEAGKQAVAKAGKPISAIGFSTIWHSLLFTDEHLRPLGRAWTWANTQASATASSVRQDSETASYLYQRTGCVPHSLFPLMQYLHQLKTKPELADRRICLSSLSAYLLYRLTGEYRYSLSNAAGSGMLNIHTLQWDEEILSRYGIFREKLIPLCEPDDSFPLSREAAAYMGLPVIPVAAGGSDGALNQIGAGALLPGRMTFSVGTSGAIRVSSPYPILPDHPSTWCYYAAEGLRIAGAATNGACNSVDWFRALVGNPSFDSLENAVRTEKDRLREAPIFLPFQWGERCPGWNDRRLGGFINLHGDDTLGTCYYAVLEGVLMNLKHCFTILTEVAGMPDVIYLSGGIAHSSIWPQMAADIFGKTLMLSEIENASCLGAAALALKAAGGLETLTDFTPPAGIPIVPDADRVILMNERFKQYLSAYERES